VAGTFFPISSLPSALHTIAKFNPLYHCVALVRDVSLSVYSSADVVHAVVLVGFALAMWRLAIWRMQAGLID
jgi:lipooligosaccharide transport system permease protein